MDNYNVVFKIDAFYGSNYLLPNSEKITEYQFVSFYFHGRSAAHYEFLIHVSINICKTHVNNSLKSM